MSAAATDAPASTETKTPEAQAAAVAAPEAPLTHPLNTEWTLWFDLSQPDKAGSWENNLHELTTVATVEAWWCLYKCLPRVSELAVGGNLSLFRRGVRPAPRSPANVNGGVYQAQGFDARSFNDVWLYSALFCLGEVSDDAHLICGTVASVAKRRALGAGARAAGTVESVTLWISTNEMKDQKTVRRLGKHYKESIGLGERKTRLPFKPHNKEFAVARATAASAAAASATSSAAAPPAGAAATAAAADAEPKP